MVCNLYGGYKSAIVSLYPELCLDIDKFGMATLLTQLYQELLFLPMS